MKTLKAPATEMLAGRFSREARVTGRLEHPNVVPVHELELDPPTELSERVRVGTKTP